MFIHKAFNNFKRKFSYYKKIRLSLNTYKIVTFTTYKDKYITTSYENPKKIRRQVMFNFLMHFMFIKLYYRHFNETRFH